MTFYCLLLLSLVVFPYLVNCSTAGRVAFSNSKDGLSTYIISAENRRQRNLRDSGKFLSLQGNAIANFELSLAVSWGRSAVSIDGASGEVDNKYLIACAVSQATYPARSLLCALHKPLL